MQREKEVFRNDKETLKIDKINVLVIYRNMSRVCRKKTANSTWCSQAVSHLRTMQIQYKVLQNEKEVFQNDKEPLKIEK